MRRALAAMLVGAAAVVLTLVGGVGGMVFAQTATSRFAKLGHAWRFAAAGLSFSGERGTDVSGFGQAAVSAAGAGSERGAECGADSGQRCRLWTVQHVRRRRAVTDDGPPGGRRAAFQSIPYDRALQSDARALITGRNHHSATFGTISEAATGYDGYICVMPRSCGTIGEVLRQNGYMTAWIGKNHNTPPWEASAAGPFDRWANGLGFDYFYGFNAGDMNHWNPVLFENRDLVPASSDPSYHLTAGIADHAIAWSRKVKSISPDRPFFLYVAPGATHSPHHVPEDWIAKFKGKFDMGWDKYREETLARQKKLGVVPPDTKLTARSAGLPAWDTLGADQKRLYAPHDGSLRRVRRALRSSHGARGRCRETDAGGREHDLHLHRRRQRLEHRRGH